MFRTVTKTFPTCVRSITSTSLLCTELGLRWKRWKTMRLYSTSLIHERQVESPRRRTSSSTFTSTHQSTRTDQRRFQSTQFTTTYQTDQRKALSTQSSTRKIYALLEDLSLSLEQHLPKFLIPPSRIRILKDPKDFYETLLGMIQNAEKTVFLSSLYVGTGNMEERLVSTLAQTLRQRPKVQVYIYLDLNRSTRPSPPLSTATFLLPLIREFPDRVHVSLFKNPNLRGFWARFVPTRWNEGWGTWHVKVYGVDGGVVLSGANLSKDYFTNRKDRYIQFIDQPRLAEYCFGFLNEMRRFSYRLIPSELVSSVNGGQYGLEDGHDHKQNHGRELGDKGQDKRAHNHERDYEHEHDHQDKGEHDTPLQKSHKLNEHSYTRENYTLLWPDPEMDPLQISEKVQKAIGEFQETWRVEQERVNGLALSEQEQENAVSPSSLITLFPLLQAGQFDLRDEERFFQFLFAHLKYISMRPVLPPVGSLPVGVSPIPLSQSREGRPLVDLTSGYFNLYYPYQKLFFFNPQVRVRIVAASPRSNGFFNSQGISRRIPEAYTYLEQRFMRRARRTARRFDSLGAEGNVNVELAEWEKEGWTYHAKGLWLSVKNAGKEEIEPVLTLFGSTNLSARSADLDIELSFVMLLPPSSPSSSSAPSLGPLSPQSLSNQLTHELASIRKDVKPWKGDKRGVSLLTRILVFFVSGKL